MADRFDNKKRKLRTGESQRKSDGRYRYTYVDNDGNTKDVYSWTLTHNDRIPAGKKYDLSLREKEAEIQKKLAEGLNTSKGNMSVLSLAKMYTDNRLKDVKPTTASVYRTNIKLLETHTFGKKKISEVSTVDAQGFLDDLHENHGKGFSSIANIRGILKPAFQMAVQNQWISFNPFAFELLKKRYGGEKTRDALTRKQMRLFLDFVRYHKTYSKYFDEFFILFNTGMRCGEFVGLTFDDIMFDKHCIRINKQLHRLWDGKKNVYYIEDSTKTPAGMRYIPMTPDVESCFRNIIQNRPNVNKEPVIKTMDGYLKVSGFLLLDKNGMPKVNQHIENEFRWARNRYNAIFKDEIKELSPHVARHTFCSNMASAGMSVKNLQYVMGHVDVSVTLNTYTHTDKEDAQSDFNETINRIMNNKQYEMYSLSREPEFMCPDDDITEEMDDDEE